MKRLLPFLFLACSLSAAPLLNLLQVEYIRGGYRPQSSVAYIDLTIPATTQAFPGYSDHATTVAKLWQANGTAALVKTWYVDESSNFELKSLLAGKIADPLPAQWHLVIMPYGDAATWSIDAQARLAKQCERDNVLAIVSPPDAGMEYFPFPCNAVSPNILHVASTTTGSYLTNQVAPDVYTATDWNSYVQPTDVATGIAQILDWLLQSNVSYKASDIKAIIIATALPDSNGHKIFNGSAALAAVKAKYSTPLPAPPPIVPVTVPVDDTPTPTPTVTPVPTTTPQPTTTVLKITSFKASNAWSSASTPTTVSWSGTGVTATITDAVGVTHAEPASGSITVTKLCTLGYTWTLTEFDSNGGKTASTLVLHGSF